MPWISHSGPRRREVTKFRSHERLGTEKSNGGQHRGWRYSFVAHQTGSGVRRVRYSVSICDSQNNRVAYLRDCSSIQQATDAAIHWIDNKLGLGRPQPQATGVGTIPSLPAAISAQEKAISAQEK